MQVERRGHEEDAGDVCEREEDCEGEHEQLARAFERDEAVDGAAPIVTASSGKNGTSRPIAAHTNAFM